MKKCLIAVLCIAVVLLVCSVAYAKTDGGEYEGIIWNFENGTLTLEGKGIVPESAPWNGYYKQVKVLTIGEGIEGLQYWDVFAHIPKLQKLIIARDDFQESFNGSELIKEVEYTGNDPAFYGLLFNMSRLNKITFVNAGDKYVQEGNFLFNSDKSELLYYLGPKKEKVTVPEGVKVIKSAAFAHSNITAIELPSTLEEIEYEAFSCCRSLKKVEIPASCKIIGSAVLGGCTSLAEVKFNQEKIEFRGYYYIRGEKIDSGGYTFCYCTTLKEIELPSCEEVPSGLFSGCSNLKKVVFGENTKKLNTEYTFRECKNLQTVYVPDDMTFDDDFFDKNGSNRPKKAVILCHAESNAEKLAIKYNLPYKLIDE